MRPPLPYRDIGPGRQHLNLSEEEALLERLYCFEDYEDDTHLVLGGARRRVILKVHTLTKWDERKSVRLWERANKVTAVKVRCRMLGDS